MPKDDSYSEQDMRDWLKSRGYNLDDGKTPTAPTTVPGGSAGAGSTTTEGEEPGFGTSLARGAGKAAVSTGIGAGRLAGQLLPTSVRKTLGQLAEEAPGFKKSREFSEEPYQNIAEGVGGVGADIATGLVMPEIGLPKLAAKMVPATKFTGTQPVWINPLGAGGRWMLQNVTKSVVNPKSVERAKLAGQVIENTGKGAVGGAATNSDNPLEGAAYGAAGGLGQRGLGAFLRHKYGQSLGDAIFRYVPSSIAGAITGYGLHGVPGLAEGAISGPGIHGMAHAVRSQLGYHGAPGGSTLGHAGRATSRGIGRGLGYVDPVTGGILTERAVKSGTDPMDVYERTKEQVSPYIGGGAAGPGQSIFSSEDYGPARPAHEQPANPGQ